jgi:ribonuclease Z
MELSIFFAGTGGSQPTPRRGLPAIVIRRGGDRILLDCGEGTQRQLVRSCGLTELDEIFLTHLHADHWLGLPGLLKTYDLRGRERPLTVYGPRGTAELLDGILRFAGRTQYELYIDELEPSEPVEHDGYTITAIPVVHRGTCFGYVLEEDDRPGVFDPAAAIAAGLQPGPEFGRVQRGEAVRGVRPEDVMGDARAGRKLVFSGDTKPCDSVRAAARGADLLVHEATFLIDEAERAHQTGHSTAAQAAGVARDAGVRMLALNHLSIRYPAGHLRSEAREIFANTVLPRDFDTLEIPFAEKGEPALIRWEDRAEQAPAAAGEGTAT